MVAGTADPTRAPGVPGIPAGAGLGDRLRGALESSLAPLRRAVGGALESPCRRQPGNMEGDAGFTHLCSSVVPFPGVRRRID